MNCCMAIGMFYIRIMTIQDTCTAIVYVLQPSGNQLGLQPAVNSPVFTIVNTGESRKILILYINMKFSVKIILNTEYPECAA